MYIAYLDCHSGISGDMTLSSLLDAGASLSSVQRVVSSMGLSDVEVRTEETHRQGFRGRLLRIAHPPQHAHRKLLDIIALIRRADMTPAAREIALRLFERLGRAEAKVHGTSIDRVHFHEVGAIDSIVDMVGVAVAWDELGIERAVASPVPTGTGQVKIAHGVVSIPAPATAELLKEVPIASCGLPFEMTTPTGAAILAELMDEYGPMPSMQVGRIGYGAGNRDVSDRPNLLRLLLGQAVQPRVRDSGSEEIWILETNLDASTGEEIGFAIEMLMQNGALDVFTTAIQMKKSRPGVLLTVLCKRQERKRLEAILLQHAGTLGIRVRRQGRVVLPRAMVQVDTRWGLVTGKVSKLPSGQVDFSPEYEECRAIALENEMRIRDVMHEVLHCYVAGETLRQAEAPPPSKAENSDNSDLSSSVNRAFQQAAYEDQEDFASPRVSWDAGEVLEAPNGLQGPMSSIVDGAAPVQQALESPQTETTKMDGKEEEIDLVYRWDSSPWESPQRGGR